MTAIRVTVESIANDGSVIQKRGVIVERAEGVDVNAFGPVVVASVQELLGYGRNAVPTLKPVVTE